MTLFLVLACSSPESPEQTCERCATDCAPAEAASCSVVAEAAEKADPPDLLRANLLAARSCDRGWGPGCAQLGLFVQDGRGVPDDDELALVLYGRACELGAGVGCMNAGVMFRDGHGVARDPVAAGAWFQKAVVAYEAQCATGDPEWCTNLGYLYEAGLAGAPDAAKAVVWYRTACDRGAVDGCANLAGAELRGEGLPLDVAGGKARLESACSAGSMVACAMWGQELVNGGVASDVARGVELLDRACAAGDGHACGALGGVFGLGDVVPMDVARADRLEQRACDLGKGTACMILGQMAAVSSPTQALALLQRACDMGQPDACMGVVGLLTQSGAGAAAAPQLGAALIDGCRLGSLDACETLFRLGLELPLSDADRVAVLASMCARRVEGACPVDPGTLEQTRDRPTADDAALRERLQGLVDAVQAGDPTLARRAFFPLAAYLQVKDLPEPERDWNERLFAAYERDLRALHTDALPGTFVRIDLADKGVRWVDPGEEYNKIGYYRVRRATVVYEVAGAERTIAVASLISWRGQWYVVHLSSM